LSKHCDTKQMAPKMLAGLLLTIVVLTSCGCNSAPLMTEVAVQHTCSEMKVHGLGKLGVKEETLSEVCKAALSDSHEKCVKDMSSCTSEEQCSERGEAMAISVGEAIATTCIGPAIFNAAGPGGMMGGLAGAMGGMMGGLAGAMGDVGGAIGATNPSDMMGGVAGAMGDMGGAMGALAPNMCNSMKAQISAPLGIKEETASGECKAALAEFYQSCVREYTSCTSVEECNKKVEAMASSGGTAIATTCVGAAIFSATGPGDIMGGVAGAMGGTLSGVAGAMGGLR